MSNAMPSATQKPSTHPLPTFTTKQPPHNHTVFLQSNHRVPLFRRPSFNGQHCPDLFHVVGENVVVARLGGHVGIPRIDRPFCVWCLLLLLLGSFTCFDVQSNGARFFWPCVGRKIWPTGTSCLLHHSSTLQHDHGRHYTTLQYLYSGGRQCS